MGSEHRQSHDGRFQCGHGEHTQDAYKSQQSIVNRREEVTDSNDMTYQSNSFCHFP